MDDTQRYLYSRQHRSSAPINRLTLATGTFPFLQGFLPFVTYVCSSSGTREVSRTPRQKRTMPGTIVIAGIGNSQSSWLDLASSSPGIYPQWSWNRVRARFPFYPQSVSFSKRFLPSLDPRLTFITVYSAFLDKKIPPLFPIIDRSLSYGGIKAVYLWRQARIKCTLH